MLSRLLRPLAGLAFALCAASAAIAAPATGTVSNVNGPAGALVPAQGVQVLGLEYGNGALCLIGSDLTCQLPSALTLGTPVTAASGNVANASAVATLPGVAGKTTYLTGFQCTAAGATAALAVNLTVTGTVTGTETFTFVFPAGVAVAAQPLIVPFPTPLSASAQNTAIAVTLPAGGTGNTNAACNAQGYQL